MLRLYIIRTGIAQVSSFNGRTGNVSPETGDYTSDMITETDGKQQIVLLE